MESTHKEGRFTVHGAREMREEAAREHLETAEGKQEHITVLENLCGYYRKHIAKLENSNARLVTVLKRIVIDSQNGKEIAADALAENGGAK